MKLYIHGTVLKGCSRVIQRWLILLLQLIVLDLLNQWPLEGIICVFQKKKFERLWNKWRSFFKFLGRLWLRRHSGFSTGGWRFKSYSVLVSCVLWLNSQTGLAAPCILVAPHCGVNEWKLFWVQWRCWRTAVHLLNGFEVPSFEGPMSCCYHRLQFALSFLS